MCGGGVDVVDVEDHAGESLVEDARRNLVGGLPGAQAVFDGAEGAHGKRAEPERHRKGDRSCADGQKSDRDEQAAAAHAERAHGDQFAIGRQSSERDEHADQDAHRQRETENAGKCGKEQNADGGPGSGVAHHQIHQTH
jgi:hypothetical protein